MDFFLKASTVRLISYNDRFLTADDDCITISHGGARSAKNAVWTVELAQGKDTIRLKSCYGTYLTASGTPVMPGVTGKRVVQTWPCQCDSATEWEPSRDGMLVRLRSIHGHFLRPNGGGLTTWRNAVTHDVPHRSKMSEKMLWDVEVVERLLSSNVHRAASPSHHVRTRSSERDEDDDDSDNDNDNEEGIYNNVKCWWYPKTCMPF